jgi:hypothetical protein
VSENRLSKDDYTSLSKDWRDTVAKAIAIAHWLEENIGAPEWFQKKDEFEALVEHADVLKELMR